MPEARSGDLGRRPRFDLVICDLDGTLVDTREGIADTFRAVLTLRGYDAPDRQEILPFIGLPLDVMFRHFLTGQSSHEDPPGVADPLAPIIADLIVAYRRRYHEQVTPQTRAFPGVRDTLLVLCSSQVRLAVATSKLTAIAVEALEAAGLLSLFARVHGMDAAERPKPAPDLALLCLSELGVSPERALVVGDAVHDVEMGRAAGCATCAVTYGAQTRSELLHSRPDRLIDGFPELLDVVLGG